MGSMNLHSYPNITTDEVRRRIEEALPGARATVETFSGADHFSAVVVAPQFRGKTLIEQHRLVYDCVQELLGGAMHALALKTRTPDRSENDA